MVSIYLCCARGHCVCRVVYPMKPASHTQLSLYNQNRFHNSTRERDERKLTAYEETNRHQDKKILAFFKAHQGPRWTDDYDRAIEGWTSFELEGEFKQMARESIRRACTNNSKDPFNPDGHLVDTGELRVGVREVEGRKIKRSYTVWKYKPFQ